MTVMSIPPSYQSIHAALAVKPFAGKGTDSVQPLYAGVGRICASFESLQDEIILLFQLLCGGAAIGKSKMAHIIGATSSFREKIKLAKAAAQAFLASEPDKKDAVIKWLKLCERASEIRNKAAHGQPMQFAYVYEGRSFQAAFLLPSYYNPKFGRQKSTESDYCWNYEQLLEYNVAIFALRAMMMTVREELANIAEDPQPHVLDPSTLVPANPTAPEEFSNTAEDPHPHVLDLKDLL